MGFPIPKGITSSPISLVPKVQKPKFFSDFRPISLCNFSYKIISSIISKSIAPILPNIISKEQGAFVNGRFILDNVALAGQMKMDIARKVRGHNAIFKLDMAKAYDRMELDFILVVLRKFGFNNRFTSLISMILSNSWFSVNFNGSMAGFFKSSRGIQQGDPLAPYLFILASEVLSRGLIVMLQFGILKCFHGPRNAIQVSHLPYVDDTLIFLNGSKNNINFFQ